MLENLKETLDKGIDFAFMTTEKITKAAKELAKENNLTKEEAKKLLDYLQKKSEQTRKTLESTMQDFVKNSLKKMDIPSKEDMKKLENRIKKLEAVNKRATVTTKKKGTPKKPAAKKTVGRPKK